MTKQELKQSLIDLELSFLPNVPDEFRDLVEEYAEQKADKLANIISEFVLSRKVQTNIEVIVGGPTGPLTGTTTSEGILI